MVDLIDGYAIDGDPRNYVVLKKSVSKTTGKEYANPVAYHQRIEDCLMFVYLRVTRQFIHENDYSLTETISVFQDIANQLIACVKESTTV